MDGCGQRNLSQEISLLFHFSSPFFFFCPLNFLPSVARLSLYPFFLRVCLHAQPFQGSGFVIFRQYRRSAREKPSPLRVQSENNDFPRDPFSLSPPLLTFLFASIPSRYFSFSLAPQTPTSCLNRPTLVQPRGSPLFTRL